MEVLARILWDFLNYQKHSVVFFFLNNKETHTTGIRTLLWDVKTAHKTSYCTVHTQTFYKKNLIQKKWKGRSRKSIDYT